MNNHLSKPRTLLTFITVGATLVLGACSNNSESASDSTTATSSNSTINMTSAVKGASWNPTVKMTFSDDVITFKPDGIPNHERDEYYAVPNAGVVVPDANTAHVIKDPTKAQSYSFEIPAIPEYTSTTTKSNLGSIGVMISGSVLYNPYEGDGKTVAMSSNFTITDADGHTASFVDKCTGHPGPNDGSYHYHGLSGCVTRKVDKEKGASHLIGIALDGFPIYGANDVNGKAVPVKSLDECNGINSPTPEFPKGIYHYVLPGTSDATSSIGCFHGKVDTSQIQQMPMMMQMPDLNAAAKKLGITVTQLKDAFNNTLPPDFTAAAKNLGITEATLKAALGVK